VPPLLTNRIEFEPALPTRRRHLAQRMPMGQVIKVGAPHAVVRRLCCLLSLIIVRHTSAWSSMIGPSGATAALRVGSSSLHSVVLLLFIFIYYCSFIIYLFMNY
jgi:hypothetical protein